MSEIFYSEVDRNLQTELNARAGAAQRRTNKDLDFMLGKIGNVTIIPYTNPNQGKPIKEAILGGKTTRSDNYLPNGFLYTSFLNKEKTPGSNKLYRTPPFITSADISISGDHSAGILNSATINFTIPDPNHIDFIEAVYFRPGRFAEVIIEHPQSACIATTTLNPTTVESFNRISKLYPEFETPAEYDSKFRQLNKVTFEGFVTSFTFDYQADFSITATITLTGTSNIYTDVTLLTDQNQKQPDKSEKPNAQSQKTIEAEVDTFYSTLKSLFEERVYLKKLEKSTGALHYSKSVPLKTSIQFNKSDTTQSKYLYGVIGSPSPTMKSEQRYITLAYLIQYINDFYLKKLRTTKVNPLPTAAIIFNEDICKSTFYNPRYYKSCDPTRIFFPDKQNRTYEHSNSKNLVWFGKLPGTNEAEILDWPAFKTKDGHYTPAAIMINLNVIDEIVKRLKSNQTFTVNDFLKEVSNEVYEASGHAIQLSLITHPEDNRFLLWYDSKFIKNTNVNSYYIPMTSNDTYGQIVRDFRFNGKLPDQAGSLGYVLGNGLSQMSESEISPYVSFLYAYSENEYTDPSIRDTLDKYELSNASKTFPEEYRKSHEDAVNKLVKSIEVYATEVTDVNSQALREAMQKFIQFPLNDIKDTNKIAAPVIPFDTEFTIDGINGFKFGDIIGFRILPTRYTTNAVFTILGVTHTIGQDGVWTTTIRSAMRAKF